MDDVNLLYLCLRELTVESAKCPHAVSSLYGANLSSIGILASSKMQPESLAAVYGYHFR